MICATFLQRGLICKLLSPKTLSTFYDGSCCARVSRQLLIPDLWVREFRTFWCKPLLPFTTDRRLLTQAPNPSVRPGTCEDIQQQLGTTHPTPSQSHEMENTGLQCVQKLCLQFMTDPAIVPKTLSTIYDRSCIFQKLCLQFMTGPAIFPKTSPTIYDRCCICSNNVVYNL